VFQACIRLISKAEAKPAMTHLDKDGVVPVPGGCAVARHRTGACEGVPGLVDGQILQHGEVAWVDDMNRL